MIDLRNVVCAGIPIVLFTYLLAGAKLPAAKAAACSLAAAVVSGMLCFSGSFELLGWCTAKGVWNAFAIFLVIAPALFIYELLQKAGMFEIIRRNIESGIRNHLLRVLFIGWAFSSFLQSITGFGVPVAVTAPILVGLGLDPIRAVLICILGHAWGGTFGTLALAWDSLFLQVPEAANNPRLLFYACILLWVYNFICGLLICLLYQGKSVRVRDFKIVALVSALQGGGQLIFAQISTSTACFMASALSMGGIFLIDRLGSGKRKALEKSGVPILHAVFPFVVLTGFVLLFLLFPPVNQFLSRYQVGLPVPDGTGRWSIYSPLSVFTHSGTLLLESSLLSLFFYRRKGYLKKEGACSAAQSALKKAASSILPILLLLVMSKVMDGTGQILVLANAAARVLAPVYPVAAPFMGVLGSFISSSNMSSNILFARFQYQASQVIGADSAAILAAQTSGGSVGNLIAASNIVLGASTVGTPEKEGEILHTMLPVALGCGLLLGLLTFWFC